MMDNLNLPNIRIFVFGTLRKDDRLDFYMEGSKFEHMCYTRGQLMLSELGSAYIDFKYQDAYTIGELYHVNYYCLLRINHLESVSAEFPTGYDIDLLPVWPYKPGEKIDFDESKKQMAFFYRRRSEPVKILSGDWVNRKNPIKEIERYLKTAGNKMLSDDQIINQLIDYLGNK
ncbi:MAG: gamma-glutamylcyclotransferase [Bacteroidales bacterium]